MKSTCMVEFVVIISLENLYADKRRGPDPGTTPGTQG